MRSSEGAFMSLESRAESARVIMHFVTTFSKTSNKPAYYILIK